MQCDMCGKKKATVHLTEIVDEQMSEMHLCEECARNKSAQMEQQFGLGDLLAGLSDAGKTASAADPKNALVCSGCGLNYEDFRKFGRLGCGQCYTSFKEHLEGLLRKIHGSSRHLGKVPVSLLPPGTAPAPALNLSADVAAAPLTVPTVEDLKKQLHTAINAEDFEQAALLRDKIRALEQKK
ncbi:MAG: UvrB/UvrC motif-containing protein [Candidatus Omnitrophica bacterium]|nr:UvrB/UvrC motif-containing protein [Candidatus Omnitrophota bacterium]